MEKRGIIKSITGHWDSLDFNYTYILLKKGASSKRVALSLNSIVEKYFNKKDYNYSLFLQKISDIIPGKNLRYPYYLEYPMHGLFLLFLLAFIILLTVIFNYTNLSIARYLTRTREVGIRKVIGASRVQVFTQVMGEAIIIAFIALLFAYPFSKYLIHLMMNMVPGHPPPVKFDENLKIFLLFGLYTLMAGFLAGILPALHFSKLKPIKVLNNFFDLKILSKIGLRKALIVFQFSLSLIFIIFTIFVYRQIEFFQTCDFGFSAKNIINVELQGIDYNLFKTEIEKNSYIQRVSASAYIPGLGMSYSEKLWKAGSKEPVLMGSLSVDCEFIENLNIILMEGENFPRHLGTDKEKFLLITQSGAKPLGFKFPKDALGKVVYLKKDQPLQIIGIVKDFFYGYLYNSSGPGPVMLRFRPQDFRYANVKVNHQNIDEAITFLEKTWDRLMPDTPFIYSKYEQRIDTMLLDFLVLQKSMGFLSLLLLSIASLGLLGMTFYSIGTRRKEIGIRKVIGASVLAVTLNLSKGFFRLLFIAIILATPISWLAGNFFLQQFPYRMEPGAGLFLMGIGLMLLIGLTTVLSQTIKAAYANPLDYIRYE
jgi:putative ABC transport system permease protein